MFTRGQIKDNITENGLIIKCMAEEFSLGLMEESMMENIMMTRNKVMVFLPGQMVVNMKATGKMVNNMVKDYITQPKARLKKVNGKRERESSG